MSRRKAFKYFMTPKIRPNRGGFIVNIHSSSMLAFQIDPGQGHEHTDEVHELIRKNHDKKKKKSRFQEGDVITKVNKKLRKSVVCFLLFNTFSEWKEF